MRRIIPGLYTFTGLVAGKVYLIEDESGLTLVDAGLPPAAGKIIRQLEAAGHRPEDVKHILITHAHPDHVGGLPALKERTGAQVIASEPERPFIEGWEPPRRPGNRAGGVMPGTPVDRVVRDGDTLEGVMGGLQVVHTPGHTPGHITFWQPERRVLFCGDVMLRLLGLRLPPAGFTVDMEENMRSIRRLADLGPTLVCFGHGEPLQNAADRLAAFAARLGAI